MVQLQLGRIPQSITFLSNYPSATHNSHWLITHSYHVLKQGCERTFTKESEHVKFNWQYSLHCTDFNRSNHITFQTLKHRLSANSFTKIWNQKTTDRFTISVKYICTTLAFDTAHRGIDIWQNNYSFCLLHTRLRQRPLNKQVYVSFAWSRMICKLTLFNFFSLIPNIF